MIKRKQTSPHSIESFTLRWAKWAPRMQSWEARQMSMCRDCFTCVRKTNSPVFVRETGVKSRGKNVVELLDPGNRKPVWQSRLRNQLASWNPEKSKELEIQGSQGRNIKSLKQFHFQGFFSTLTVKELFPPLPGIDVPGWKKTIHTFSKASKGQALGTLSHYKG